MRCASVHGKPIEELTEACKQLMKYGTDHEVDAMATLAAVVIPVWFSGFVYVEEGAYFCGKWQP